jgi:hypothetical protein
LRDTILSMPVGDFSASDLTPGPGYFMGRLREDGIVVKAGNNYGQGAIWRRGPNWDLFAEALRC